MKKLTIYRHGEYDKRLHLLPQSAYELFSQAKKLKDELGPVEAIYVSPVIRALQSAAVIQLVMQERSNGDRNWLTIMRRLCGRLPKNLLKTSDLIIPVRNIFSG